MKQQQIDFDKKTEEVSKKYTSQIIELNKKIEYLQLTPAKRRKIEEGGTKSSSIFDQKSEINIPIEDGGSF